MKNILILISFLFHFSCNSGSKESENNLKTKTSNFDSKTSKTDMEDKAYEASKFGDLNHLNQAINLYSQLIKEDSLNGGYYFGRADVYLTMNKNIEATQDYFKSVELNYRKGSCYFNIGLLNTFVNDSIAALYFKKALDIYPKIEVVPRKEVIQNQYDESIERLRNEKSTNKNSE